MCYSEVCLSIPVYGAYDLKIAMFPLLNEVDLSLNHIFLLS